MTDVLCLVDDVYVDDHSAEVLQEDGELPPPPPPPAHHLHDDDDNNNNMGGENGEGEVDALEGHDGQQQLQPLPTSQIPTLVEAALSENAALMFAEELAAGHAWAAAFSHPAILVLTQFAWCVCQGRQAAATAAHRSQSAWPTESDNATPHMGESSASQQRQGADDAGCSGSSSGGGGGCSQSCNREENSSSGNGSGSSSSSRVVLQEDSYSCCMYGVRLMSVYVFYVSTFEGPPGLLTWAWICAVCAWFLGPLTTNSGASLACRSTADKCCNDGGGSCLEGCRTCPCSVDSSGTIQGGSTEPGGGCSGSGEGSGSSVNGLAASNDVQPGPTDPAPTIRECEGTVVAAWFGVAVASASQVFARV